jgi:hypothetical protein
MEVETGVEAAVLEEKGEVVVEEEMEEVAGLVATQGVGQVALFDLLRALVEVGKWSLMV